MNQYLVTSHLNTLMELVKLDVMSSHQALASIGPLSDFLTQGEAEEQWTEQEHVDTLSHYVTVTNFLMEDIEKAGAKALIDMETASICLKGIKQSISNEMPFRHTLYDIADLASEVDLIDGWRGDAWWCLFMSALAKETNRVAKAIRTSAK